MQNIWNDVQKHTNMLGFWFVKIVQKWTVKHRNKCKCNRLKTKHFHTNRHLRSQRRLDPSPCRSNAEWVWSDDRLKWVQHDGIIMHQDSGGDDGLIDLENNQNVHELVRVRVRVRVNLTLTLALTVTLTLTLTSLSKMTCQRLAGGSDKYKGNKLQITLYYRT